MVHQHAIEAHARKPRMQRASSSPAVTVRDAPRQLTHLCGYTPRQGRQHCFKPPPSPASTLRRPPMFPDFGEVHIGKGVRSAAGVASAEGRTPSPVSTRPETQPVVRRPFHLRPSHNPTAVIKILPAMLHKEDEEVPPAPLRVLEAVPHTLPRTAATSKRPPAPPAPPQDAVPGGGLPTLLRSLLHGSRSEQAASSPLLHRGAFSPRPLDSASAMKSKGTGSGSAEASTQRRIRRLQWPDFGNSKSHGTGFRSGGGMEANVPPALDLAACGDHQAKQAEPPQADLDCKAFVKFCKTHGLLDEAFTADDARLVFSGTVPLDQTHMDRRILSVALAHVTANRRISEGRALRLACGSETRHPGSPARVRAAAPPRSAPSSPSGACRLPFMKACDEVDISCELDGGVTLSPRPALLT